MKRRCRLAPFQESEKAQNWNSLSSVNGRGWSEVGTGFRLSIGETGSTEMSGAPVLRNRAFICSSSCWFTIPVTYVNSRATCVPAGGPDLGDDTANLIAILKMFQALDRRGLETKGDLIFYRPPTRRLVESARSTDWIPAVTNRICSWLPISQELGSGTEQCGATSSSSSILRRERTRWKAAASRAG